MEEEQKLRGAICFIMFLAVAVGIILRMMGGKRK